MRNFATQMDRVMSIARHNAERQATNPPAANVGDARALVAQAYVLRMFASWLGLGRPTTPRDRGATPRADVETRCDSSCSVAHSREARRGDTRARCGTPREDAGARCGMLRADVETRCDSSCSSAHSQEARRGDTRARCGTPRHDAGTHCDPTRGHGAKLERLPHDLHWRPSRDRVLVRRPQDAHDKQLFTQVAANIRLRGPSVPGRDAWPLEAEDWMLAADLRDREAAGLTVPPAWEAAKCRRWLASLPDEPAYAGLRSKVSARLRAAEVCWREALVDYFARPEADGGGSDGPLDLATALRSLALHPP